MNSLQQKGPRPDYRKGEMPVSYFTKEVNPSLDKLTLKFSGSLANLVLTPLIKYATNSSGEYFHHNISWVLPVAVDSAWKGFLSLPRVLEH